MPRKRLVKFLGLTLVVLLAVFSGVWIYARVTHQRISQLLSFDKIKAAIKGEKGFDGHLKLLRRGNLDLKEVALTIDDGPHPKWATMILNALRIHHVHATFFVVGKMVGANPDLAKLEVADGHELGNHSMTHPRFDEIPLEDVKREIIECQDAVKKATGYEMKYLRPPGVRYTDKVLAAARDMGLTTIGENIGAHDFVKEGDYSWTPGNPGFPGRVKGVVHDVVKQLKNGGIIDLHDMPATAYAMSDLIEQIEANGYKIVTVSEMLSHLSR